MARKHSFWQILVVIVAASIGLIVCFAWWCFSIYQTTPTEFCSNGQLAMAGSLEFRDFLAFSTVNWTGHGTIDIGPNSHRTRTIVVLECLLGNITLVVVIAGAATAWSEARGRNAGRGAT